MNRSEIDAVRWDAAISNSETPFIYGLSWYLDIVTNESWDALILGDYKAVMPLPKFNKWFISHLYRPLFVQQLGVFASATTVYSTDEFVSAIPSKFKRIEYPFHFKTDIHSRDIQLRTNLILPLNRTFEETKLGYGKSLRKRLRKSEDILTLKPTVDVERLIQFYRQNVGEPKGMKEDVFTIANTLFDEFINRSIAQIFEVEDENGELVAMGLFVTHFGRIINLFGASNAKGKQTNAMHFMLDKVIQTHSESNLILDFEGSDIKGVKAFFESFGSKNETYKMYNFSRFPKWLTALIQRIRTGRD